jgi:multiple sugar transport system permease protein
MTDQLVTVGPGGRAGARRGRRSRWRGERPQAGGSRTAGYFFVALYVAMLLCLGVAPTVYAISLALRTSHGIGVANFVNSYHLPEFVPAFKHVLLFEAIWLVSQSVLVVSLALIVHNQARRVSATFRFIFYLPGAMAGAASVVI